MPWLVVPAWEKGLWETIAHISEHMQWPYVKEWHRGRKEEKHITEMSHWQWHWLKASEVWSCAIHKVKIKVTLMRAVMTAVAVSHWLMHETPQEKPITKTLQIKQQGLASNDNGTINTWRFVSYCLLGCEIIIVLQSSFKWTISSDMVIPAVFKVQTLALTQYFACTHAYSTKRMTHLQTAGRAEQ